MYTYTYISLYIYIYIDIYIYIYIYVCGQPGLSGPAVQQRRALGRPRRGRARQRRASRLDLVARVLVSGRGRGVHAEALSAFGASERACKHTVCVCLHTSAAFLYNIIL